MPWNQEVGLENATFASESERDPVDAQPSSRATCVYVPVPAIAQILQADLVTDVSFMNAKISCHSKEWVAGNLTEKCEISVNVFARLVVVHNMLKGLQ